MSRITASEARGLLEAYSSVYASQELTEEQIWEEVENWVNSLLEEGYDLSEYTWEEMYEEYLNELSNLSAGGGQAQIQDMQKKNKNLTYSQAAAQVERRGREAKTAKDVSGARTALQSGRSLNVGGVFGGSTVRMDSDATRKQGRTVLRTTNTGFLRGAADPTITLGGRKFDRLTSGDKINYIERKPVKPKPAAQPLRQQPPADTQPAAQPLRQQPPAAAKTEPTRPAAPAKPATGMLGKTSFERRTPTSAELKAAQAARAGGANPEQALRAAKAAGTASKIQSAGQTAGAKAFSSPTAGASAFKPATIAAAPSTSPSASGSLAPATASIASKPSSAMSQDAIRKQRLNMEMEYDAFDLVLEYLIDNGHVETVDEALYVMMEMEAEVIQDIVEATRRTEYLQKKFDDQNKRKSGSAHTAIPGKQNTGQALQKARESERHMRGDK